MIDVAAAQHIVRRDAAAASRVHDSASSNNTHCRRLPGMRSTIVHSLRISMATPLAVSLCHLRQALSMESAFAAANTHTATTLAASYP
jgi:hypothetical protein